MIGSSDVEDHALGARLRAKFTQDQWLDQPGNQSLLLDLLWAECPEAMVAADRQLSRCGDYVFVVWVHGIYVSGGLLNRGCIDWRGGKWTANSPENEHLVDP